MIYFQFYETSQNHFKGLNILKYWQKKKRAEDTRSLKGVYEEEST